MTNKVGNQGFSGLSGWVRGQRRSTAILLVLGLGHGMLPSLGLASESESNAISGIYPILQSVTSATETQFSVLVPKALRVRVRYRALPTAGAPATPKPNEWVLASEIERAERPYSREAALSVVLRGLVPKQEYELEVTTQPGASDRRSDVRRFATLPISAPALRVALVSCASDNFAFRGIATKMWRNLLRQQPEVMFFVGDNVYVSDALNPKVSAEDYWNRTVQTRKRLDVYRARRLIPTFATWDDHDFGPNNTTGDNPLAAEATAVFETFYPRRSVQGWQAGPGVASVWRAFGQRFVFLDGRTFRDEPGPGSMWGTVQERWLADLLTSDEQRPTWLINGTQFFDRYDRKESLERDFPNALTRLSQSVARLQQPLVFASGDIHFTEVNRIEPPLLPKRALEITSSAMHSPRRPLLWGPKDPACRRASGGSMPCNPRRIVGIYDHSFVVVDASLTASRHGMGYGLVIEGFTEASVPQFRLRESWGAQPGVRSDFAR